MGELADLARKRSKYISISADEPFYGTYEGFNEVPSAYDPTKWIIAYKFNGRIFNSGSSSLMTQMDAVPVGTKVKILKTGSGKKTRYVVEALPD